MAKQLVGPVERHIEKAVLALAGLALLACVAMYLVTSPNKIEISAEMVGPGNIDRQVLEKAELVRQRLKSCTLPEDDFEPLYEDFAARLDAFQYAGLPLEDALVATIGPAVPIIDKAAKTTQDRTLVEIMPVPKPVVISGRSSLQLDPDEYDGGRFVQTEWATISTIFEFRKQSEKQQLEYGSKMAEVVLASLDLQRRAQRADGSWSDDDWESVTPWPATELGAIPPVPLIEEDGVLSVNKKAFTRINQFYEFLRELPIQLSLIRPMMPDIRDGDPWDVPVITSRHDVLIQDMGYLFPGDPPEPPEDRYSETGAVSNTPSTGAQEEEETPKSMLQAANTFLDAARKTCSANDATRAYNKALEVSIHKAARRADKSQATRLMTQAEDLNSDIRRPGGCTPAGSAATVVTDKERPPFQQIWVHDARPGSIQSGGTYQYRVRPVVFNRLAAQPTKFKDPLMAKTVFLNGPWSDPSDAVTFEPEIYYYATGSSQRDDVVTVELYKWFEGVWVKTKIKYLAGASVEARKRHEVPSQTAEGEVERPLIAFDTGMSIVDIDHERLYRTRKRGGRGSVAFDQRSKVCSVVFADRQGHLHERFVPLDKGNPAKSANAARVFKPPRTKK